MNDKTETSTQNDVENATTEPSGERELENADIVAAANELADEEIADAIAEVESELAAAEEAQAEAEQAQAEAERAQTAEHAPGAEPMTVTAEFAALVDSGESHEYELAHGSDAATRGGAPTKVAVHVGVETLYEDVPLAPLAVLQANAISAWFGDRKVLDRVDLTMEAGKITALIGPSGCGKSTFLRILNRMHEMVPTASLAGEVLLDGEDIYGATRRLTQARRDIGMVFQKDRKSVV